MMHHATATAVQSGGAPWWLAILLGALTLIFGTGGISAVIKARGDRQVGVATQEVSEEDAQQARWQSIIETQTVSLLGPLKDRLKEVEARVETLEKELDVSRRRYWSAIGYIRHLLSWVHKHVPDQQVPQSPAILAEDI